MTEEAITKRVTFEEVPPETIAEIVKAERERTLSPYTAFLQAGWNYDHCGVSTYSDDYEIHMWASFHDYDCDKCDREGGYSLEVDGTDYNGVYFDYVYDGISPEDTVAYVEAIKQALRG